MNDSFTILGTVFNMILGSFSVFVCKSKFSTIANKLMLPKIRNYRIIQADKLSNIIKYQIK